jgi:hypothetical protein
MIVSKLTLFKILIIAHYITKIPMLNHREIVVMRLVAAMILAIAHGITGTLVSKFKKLAMTHSVTATLVSNHPRIIM